MSKKEALLKTYKLNEKLYWDTRRVVYEKKMLQIKLDRELKLLKAKLEYLQNELELNKFQLKTLDKKEQEPLQERDPWEAA